MLDLFRFFAATCTKSNGDTYETFFNMGCTTEQVLMNILNWLSIGVAIVVLGGVIYGAVMYTTAAGNTEKTKQALGIIRNAFIALLMYFAMWALLNWLVPGGLFN